MCICGKEGDLECDCEQQAYCSEECQLSDWGRHSRYCPLAGSQSMLSSRPQSSRPMTRSSELQASQEDVANVSASDTGSVSSKKEVGEASRVEAPNSKRKLKRSLTEQARPTQMNLFLDRGNSVRRQPTVEGAWHAESNATTSGEEEDNREDTEKELQSSDKRLQERQDPLFQNRLSTGEAVGGADSARPSHTDLTMTVDDIEDARSPEPPVEEDAVNCGADKQKVNGSSKERLEGGEDCEREAVQNDDADRLDTDDEADAV